MKPGKSPGEDGIQVDIIKKLHSDIFQDLCMIFNTCLEVENIPNTWTIGKIKLIPKSNNKGEPSEFRPITLLQVMYKIFSSIIESRLSNFFSKNNLISSYQAGFRKGYSTHSQINILNNILEDRKQFNSEIHIIYIDFVKAYDSVEHWAIKQILEYYKVDTKIINLISNIHKSSNSFITLNIGDTSPFPLERGIRQGDGIAPLLFLIFINPLLEQLNKLNGYSFSQNQNLKVSAVGFADDCCLVSNTRDKILKSFEIVQKYCNFYGTQINTKKTEYSYLSPNNIIFQTIQHNGEDLTLIPPNQHYKYLGTWTNLFLSKTKNTEEILKKINSKIKILHTKKLNIDIKVELINKVIAPTFAYHLHTNILNKNEIKELNNNLCEIVKHSISLPKKVKNEQFWMKQKDFGFGLIEVERWNHQLFANHFYYHCLNGENKILRETTLQRLKDLNLEKYFITDTKFPKTEIKSDNCQAINFLSILKVYKLKCQTTKIFHSLPVKNCINQQNQNLLSKLGKFTFEDFSDGKQLLFIEELNTKLPPEINLSINEYEELQNSCSNKYNKLQKKWLINKNEEKDIFPPNNRLTEESFYRNQNELWIWTDGSCQSEINEDNTITSQASWGAFTKENSAFNKGGRTNEVDSSLEGELEAIEYTLSKIPLGKNIRIFCDCKPAITLITNEYNLTDGKMLKNKQICVIRRIHEQLKKLKESNTEIYLEWIPSHIEEKMNTLKDDPIKLDKLQKVLSEIHNKYLNSILLIINGNEQADKIAKHHNEDIKHLLSPKGTNDFIIVNSENQMETGDLGKQIKEKNFNYFKNNWNNHTFYNKSNKFDPQLSNYLLKTENKLRPFLMKLRNKRLNGNSEMRQKIRKNSDDFITNRLKALYPSDECLFCGGNKENTAHIIGFCKKWEPIRNTIITKTQEIIFNETNQLTDIKVWYLTNEKQKMGEIKGNYWLGGSLGYFPKELKKQIKEITDNKEQTIKLCKKIHENTISTFKLIYKTRNEEFWKLKQNDKQLHPNIKRYKFRKMKEKIT